MKIREVKISNLLSFPYLEDFNSVNGIIFEKEDALIDMNILIGANGAGKSNFIEIIKQFSTNLILDYTFDQEILNEGNNSTYKQAIKLNQRTTSKLSKHSKYQNKPSTIEIRIELFENDFDNIEFVCKNVHEINCIIDKYSELDYRFPIFDINHIRNEIKEICINATFDEKTQNFYIDKNSLSPMEIFSLACIQEKELLYICSHIHNKREKKTNNDYRYPPYNSFSIISSKRDLTERSYLNDFHDFDNYIFKKSNETNPNLEGYYKCLNKIRTTIKRYSSNEYEDGNIELVKSREKKLYETDFWKRLTSYIEKFLNKKLTINHIQGSLNLELQNQDGDPCYFEDLGTGQQSLLLILFSLLGNDLKNGFMIIDEPELHTHPQIQKELALLLNQISEKIGTQFIISTYSAHFINESNITNVYRFSKNNNGTKVFTPNIKIASDDAKLVHLLRYENLTKIFFVNKIIMVEGDSDVYFFSHYLKRLQEQPGREHITGTYEIVNINGKGSYKARHKFLNKFGIENYFIGDWDNTVDYGFFTNKELGKYYQLANKHIKDTKASSGDYYNRLVFTIRKFYPQKYRRIIEGIEALYEENVYILKLGAIESYPCLEKKGLQYMINYCNYDFEDRLISSKTNEQRNELLDIFGCIFQIKKEEKSDFYNNPF